MLKNNLLSTAACCIIAAALTSCSLKSDSSSTINSDKPASRDIFAMDTYMSVKAYGENADNALDKAVERVYSLESELSVTDENSDVWKINHADGNTVAVSDDTMNIIQKACEISDDTNGALNICLYPVLSAWGFTTSQYRIPSESELTSLLKNTDYNRIELKNGTVSLPENYQIDLGAVAKGYTGDQIIDIMRENGVSSAIVSLGGNVQSLGSKPDGSLWKVAVRDPFSPEMDMCVIDIDEKAVITSGNYERFFTGSDGKDYWHIIDGSDGYPADNGFVSVTVIGGIGIECDALSTALFVMGKPDAFDYCRKRTDIDAIFVTDDKKIFYTEGLENSFKNLSSMSAEVIPLA